MAYVDHAFSITDEDMMVETSYTMNNKAPIKEIALAVSLLVFGTLGIIIGIFMAINHIGGDRAHGTFLAFFTQYPLCVFLLWLFFVFWVWDYFDFSLLGLFFWLGVFFAILGSILFIPGFYYTRIAYYAYKGYKGFSFSNIPAV